MNRVVAEPKLSAGRRLAGMLNVSLVARPAGAAGAAPDRRRTLEHGAAWSRRDKRSLVYHAWVTLSSTLLGFVLGTVLGIALAVGDRPCEDAASRA